MDVWFALLSQHSLSTPLDITVSLEIGSHFWYLCNEILRTKGFPSSTYTTGYQSSTAKQFHHI